MSLNLEAIFQSPLSLTTVNICCSPTPRTWLGLHP